MVDTPDLPVLTDQQLNPPFLGLYLEEDMGLKTALSGLTVTDLNAQEPTPRPVPVWFLNPEREERRVTYPSITINFMRERVAHEREHRGWVPVGYRYLQNIPFDPNRQPFMDFPIPMDLDYQITINSRINQHISQIGGSLALGPLNPRFGQLDCPGGTTRRIEVLSMSTANGQEGDRRIFRRIYLVRIPTEVETAVALTSRVRAVAITTATGLGEYIGGTAGITIVDTLSKKTVYVTGTTGHQNSYDSPYPGGQSTTGTP